MNSLPRRAADRISREPVLTAASLAGLVSAAITFARLMGWLRLTDDQFNALMTFVGLLLPILFAIWARSKVTPVYNQREHDEY